MSILATELGERATGALIAEFIDPRSEIENRVSQATYADWFGLHLRCTRHNRKLVKLTGNGLDEGDAHYSQLSCGCILVEDQNEVRAAV